MQNMTTTAATRRNPNVTTDRAGRTRCRIEKAGNGLDILHVPTGALLLFSGDLAADVAKACAVTGQEPGELVRAAMAECL